MVSPAPLSNEQDEDGDTPTRSEDEMSESDSSSRDEEEEQTEWLVTTREKRSTAGNRLSTLIQQAAAEDDDLALLFEEDENDVGFEVLEDDASDVQMDSSDDDDDQGPDAGTEELEGEKELQQQARTEKQSKKRKANDMIPKVFRKKVKIDPTAPNASLTQPKKKSERASWIPAPDEAPTRASARSTTRLSKEQLHAQMVDREKRRLKQLVVMEKAAKRKEAAKPKKMTQEDRLAAAARMEKHNAKSLNSWEEAEKAREEERKAKLAALQNRKLQGPFITWWSGMAEWVGGKLKRVGKNLVVEERQRGTYTKKRKADEMLDETLSTPVPAASSTALNLPDIPIPSVGASETDVVQSHPPVLDALPVPSTSKSVEDTTTSQAQTDPQPIPPSMTSHPANPQFPPPAPPTTLDGSAPLSNFHNPPQGSTPLPGPPPTTPTPSRMIPSQTTPFTFAPIPAPPPADLPPAVENGTYNCLILENFNENSVKSKDIQCQILFNRKFPKPQKGGHPTLCAITAYPARFRDPSTNLPYCNAYAYKEIQKLKKGEYRWSTLLQAYVGQTQYAARGVPTRFSQNPVLQASARSQPTNGAR